MNKKDVHIVILLADGFEEIETVVPYDLLVRAGFTVKTIAFSEDSLVSGSRGLKIQADKHKTELGIDAAIKEGKLPHAVVVPGGLMGTENLAKEAAVSKLLDAMHKENRLIAAICAAPVVVLSPLGILKNKRYTAYPGMEKKIAQYAGIDFQKKTENALYIADEALVQDGNLLTSNGPGSASVFAFGIIEHFAGKELAESIAKESIF